MVWLAVRIAPPPVISLFREKLVNVPLPLPPIFGAVSVSPTQLVAGVAPLALISTVQSFVYPSPVDNTSTEVRVPVPATLDVVPVTTASNKAPAPPPSPASVAVGPYPDPPSTIQTPIKAPPALSALHSKPTPLPPATTKL